MEVGGNKNLYIILAVFVGAVAAIVALLYVYSKKQQKAFEDAMNEVKDEAIKHLRNHAEPPFSEYEDVTNKPAETTNEEPAAETESQPQEQTEEQTEEQISTPTYTVPVVFTATVTQQPEPVNAEVEIPVDNPANTTLNFKTASMVKEYVQAPTKEPLPKAEAIKETEPTELKAQVTKPAVKPAPKPKVQTTTKLKAATPSKKTVTEKTTPKEQVQNETNA